MRRELTTLSDLARLGFSDLGGVRGKLEELEALVGTGEELLPLFGGVADPDQALDELLRLARRHPAEVTTALSSAGAARRLLLVLGASTGLADFLSRRPDAFSALAEPMPTPPTPEELLADLLDAVSADEQGVAALEGDEGRVALRVQIGRASCRERA